MPTVSPQPLVALKPQRVLLQRVVDAGIGDQNLVRAELALQGRHQRARRRGVSHVRIEHARGATQRTDLCGDPRGRTADRLLEASA